MTIDGHVLAFVMAGGQGARLKILTKDDCKAVIRILGQYRIFDFVATNIADTGISNMLVATQYKRESLNGYIKNGEVWGFNGNNRKLEILPPHENGKKIIEFEGTADSVRKNINLIDRYNSDIILVLSSDHIYVMDYRDVLMQHINTNADITIMTNVISDNKVKDLGIVKIEESGRIIDFAEKPVEDSVIENFKLTPKIKKLLGIDDPNLNFLASMGNYVFFWNQLKKFLDFPGVDFGKDIIPAIKGTNGALYAYVFNGYWRDIGKVRDYFNCNVAFANGKAPIDLSKHRIRTQKAFLPSPHIAIGSSINGTILSPGDVIHKGSTVRNSVLGYQVAIEKGCKIEHCVFLGDEKNGVHSAQMNGRRYTTQIGKYSSLSHTILHENVWIGEGVDISPYNGTSEERKEILKSVGLRPYTKLNDGTVEGDFYIEPDTGILVIGKQYDADPKKPILPDGLKC